MKRKQKAQRKEEDEEVEEFKPIEDDSDLDALSISDGEGESDEESEKDEQDKKNPNIKYEEFTQKAVYKSDALDASIQALKDGFYSRLDSKKLIKRDGKIPFTEHMAMVNDSIVVLPANENVHNDLKRELCFYNLTLLDTKEAMKILLQANVKIGRPNDYFAEMFKPDDHMRKVKSKILKQEEKIKRFEERKLRVDNKRFRKWFLNFLNYRILFNPFL